MLVSWSVVLRQDCLSPLSSLLLFLVVHSGSSLALHGLIPMGFARRLSLAMLKTFSLSLLDMVSLNWRISLPVSCTASENAENVFWASDNVSYAKCPGWGYGCPNVFAHRAEDSTYVWMTSQPWGETCAVWQSEDAEAVGPKMAS